ncbi:putative cleavage and polyadenylation specificity factor subunit 4-like protein [Plecturocebus cupreus]
MPTGGGGSPTAAASGKATLFPLRLIESGSAVCNFHKGLCEKGKLCPFRHDRGEKTVVCKHWLRGLCKKGDHCKFLQQCDLTRMPNCCFYSAFRARSVWLGDTEIDHKEKLLLQRVLGFSGDCSSNECPFLHVKPALRSRNCPWDDQGFCKDGEALKAREH